MDTRVEPEDDNRRRMFFKPEYDKDLRLSTSILNHLSNVILGFIPRIHTEHSPLDTRVKPEYDGKRNLIKGLDVVCQCAALLERRVQSGTQVRKAQAVTRQTNPTGRSMIEMLGVLAIIGVLSVGGIQGFSKAMREYRSNQQKQQLSQIFGNAISLRSSIGTFPETLENITYVLDALNEVPDGLTYTDSVLKDNYGNTIILKHGLSSSYYYLLNIVFSKNNTLFSPSGEDFCKNTLQIIKAFRNDVNHICIWNGNGASVDCLANQQLTDAVSSPIEIQQTCQQYCHTTETRCSVNVVLDYAPVPPKD